MKTSFFMSFFLLACVFTYGQNHNTLDTIYANDQKNVALFFPQTVTQGITGSENFVFTYNREKQQTFGLLQATPGQESNLLVICGDGSIYSYILQYKKQLSRLNYFISESESIGNIKTSIPDSLKSVRSEKMITERNNYYNRFCAFLLASKQRIGRIKNHNQGMVLSIENIVFNNAELYFVIRIENHSSLDYDVNFLNLSVHTRQKGKRKSAQSLLQKPVFKYQLPATIKEGQTARLVYVFPKFSISKDRRVILELNEENGERNIALKISHRLINNPN